MGGSIADREWTPQERARWALLQGAMSFLRRKAHRVDGVWDQGGYFIHVALIKGSHSTLWSWTQVIEAAKAAGYDPEEQAP